MTIDAWRAESLYRRKQAEHDRTKRHVWLELTLEGEARRRYMCQFCTKIRLEPAQQQVKLRIEG